MAQQVNLPLIEDLTLANIVLGKEPPPPLAAYAQEEAVISIGSLGKIFWAGLRVGWIRGTVSLIERLARLKAVTDLGYSLHAGQVTVADGTPQAAERFKRVLTNDPGTGVMRHVDAGYEEAIECAQERGVKMPML